ncbi:MAG: carboxypeptidase-like regulatory domain-containing protein, partial [Flavobacterium sp.]|nr:carboxypeptidase-like regulatory domain-containing protein [Flavobacterium sp.]
MKKSFLLIFFLAINVSLFSQMKGKVIDDKNQPIPFVNIQIENENIGTTSEENGTFIIHELDKNKNLVFSAIGYQKQIAKATNDLIVTLQTSEYQLNEVVIVKKFGTKEKEIGKTDNITATAFDNGPKIDAKFFPYLPKYSKTRFIKQIAIQTDSKLDNANFKIHLYSVDKNGFPADELLHKNLILSVSNGIKKTFFNILDYNLQIPKNGIFVAFEKLIIEKNKLEKSIIDKNNGTIKIQKTYYPFVLCNYVE